MTTLYLRHPAKAAVDGSPSAPPCQFALVGDGGALLQQGAAALGSLTDLIAAARRVVLLLAASDATLLRVKIPPLSGAQLKLALPSLVEEQILGDPHDCVLVAAPAAAAGSSDGMRTVAVVQRAWLEVLVKALLAQGARSIKALPAQLCLPLEPGTVAAAISSDDAGLELTLRQSQYEGYGLALAPAPAAALHMLRALAQGMPVTLYVAASELARYQDLLAELDADQADGADAADGSNQLPIKLEAEHWAHWVAASKTVTLDLIPALGAAANQARNWKRWRWPLRLGLVMVLVNLAGINIEWMHLKRDAEAVRLGMLQTFKAAYPKETVILDPEAQMRKNIGIAKLASGQLGADEFTSLAAVFGEAIGGLSANSVIATLEYRERALFVKVKPDTVDVAAQARIKAALLARQLALSELSPGIWQIRTVSANPGAQP